MITILTSTGADRERWLTVWQRTGREAFAHPGFVDLFVDAGARAVCVVDEQPGGTVVLPLLLRELPADLVAGLPRVPAAPDAAPDEPPAGGRWVDAVSPYGYGGPYASGDVDWRAFYAGLLASLRQLGVVSCFVRTALEHDPGAGDGLPGFDPVPMSQNVRIDLTRAPEEQWRHYAHKVRKNVRKAERAGLVATIREDGVDVAELLDVYLETMERRQADARYHFDAAFFSALLAVDGCAVVAEVRTADDELVSTEVVLVGDRHLYSFLGGTRAAYFPAAPNDLLKTAVVDYGHRTGRRHYVLGGGFAPDDGIFSYKRSFDVDGVVPFVGLRLTPDPRVYALLCAAAGQQSGGASASDYFPAYRRSRTGSVA